MPSFCSFVFCLFVLHLSSFSQSIHPQATKKDSSFHFAEVNYYGSSSQTPFWMRSNQFGIVPSESKSGNLNIGLEHFTDMSRYLPNIDRLRVGVGIEASLSYPDAKVRLPQAFGAIRFKNWEIFVGRKKQWVGLADSTIGMGSYVWSTNAMPIPKIQIGTSGFVSIPFTNNWLAVNAFYSDGLFEKQRPVTQNLKLHQKAIYLGIGRPASRIRLYGGFNHQAEWGGRSPYHTIGDRMPDGLKNYFNVVVGKAHVQSDKITHFDSTSRIGNHLGTIDLGMEIETITGSVFVYRQNIYEDGSLYYLNNIADGLNGIRFRRKNLYSHAFSIKEVAVEFLHTKSQGGSVANVNAYIRGKDDYFNNAQVRDGWSYFDRTIGTPFIAPTSDTKWKWPVYADFFTSNNRVSVWHLGLSGECAKIVSWSAKFSYSTNAGTYNLPFESAPGQFSGLIAFQIPVNLLGKSIIKCSFATDLGELYPKTYGFSVGLRKSNFQGML